MQDGRKAVFSIPYISMAFFLSLSSLLVTELRQKYSWGYCIFEKRKDLILSLYK